MQVWAAYRWKVKSPIHICGIHHSHCVSVLNKQHITLNSTIMDIMLSRHTCTMPLPTLVSRGQTLFFAQGRYRFQYKRPARILAELLLETIKSTCNSVVSNYRQVYSHKVYFSKSGIKRNQQHQLLGDESKLMHIT